jgi:hypothetical protein
MEVQPNPREFDDAGVYGDPADATRPQESERTQRPATTSIGAPEVETLEFHPLANIFPLLEGEEFDRLVADINRNGLIENIILMTLPAFSVSLS